MATIDGVRALTFDVGGTVLDWHRGISRAAAEIGAERGVSADWPRFANTWRRRALAAALGERKGPTVGMNIDAIHAHVLDGVLAELGITGLTAADKAALVRSWHALPPWPDAPRGIARLRERYVVAGLTILSVSMIVDVSRRAPFTWDAVMSCEMIGHYKPLPIVYETGAAWLGRQPPECLMVAAHNIDLRAAREVGFRTAYVHRPEEWGPEPHPDPTPDADFDVIADDLEDLAGKLGA